MGCLNGANMISALHMRRNSLFYDKMGRVKVMMGEMGGKVITYFCSKVGESSAKLITF